MRKICFISVLLSLLLAGCGHPEVRRAQGLIDRADTLACGLPRLEGVQVKVVIS